MTALYGDGDGKEKKLAWVTDRKLGRLKFSQLNIREEIDKNINIFKYNLEGQTKNIQTKKAQNLPFYY